MAYLRVFTLVLAVLCFYLIGAPIQRLALGRGWRLADRMPGFFHRTMCRLLRVHVRVEGALSREKPLLIVSNHLSWVDILALSCGDSVCFLAKREVRSWPIFGTFAVLQRSIFVDRERIADLPKVNAEIARRLIRGDRVVLFAESTTTDGSRMLPFRAAHFGAAEAALEMAPDIPHVVVQPVAIAYVSRDGHTEVPWYGGMALLPHLWRIVKGGPYDCMISIGEPIFFTRDTSRKRAARAAEFAVRRLLGYSAPKLAAAVRDRTAACARAQLSRQVFS